MTLRLKDGLGVEIQSVNGAVSDGDGQVNISAFTETEETYEPATAALQIEEGKIYAFKINDSMINIDTTAAGLRQAVGGTLTGAISEAASAIRTAIDMASGAGNATVDTALSSSGTSIMFDMTDASGNPIVVSEVQALTRPAQTAGSMVINQDVTNPNPVIVANGDYTVAHGEYLTDDGQSSGTPLAIDAGTTATLSFSNSSQPMSSRSMLMAMDQSAVKRPSLLMPSARVLWQRSKSWRLKSRRLPDPTFWQLRTGTTSVARTIVPMGSA